MLFRSKSSVIAGYVKRGFVFQGNTYEELAEALGVDAATFAETMNTWNTYVEAKNDPDFGRTSFAQPLNTAPYYAIKVTAGVHHTMGGLVINTDTEVLKADGTAIAGLYAAGEVTGGVHGANRLGGNSLLDACLFGTRSGKAMAERVVDNPVNDPMAEPADEASIDAVSQAADKRSAQVKELLTRPSDDDDASSDNPYQLMADLGSVMEQAVAVRCDRNSIEQALATLDDTLTPRAEALHAHSDSPTFNQEITAIWEVRHLLELGKAVLAASDARHESRGSLKRLDFPERDDEHFLAHSMTDVSCQVSWQPVHIVDMPPKAREY